MNLKNFHFLRWYFVLMKVFVLNFVFIESSNSIKLNNTFEKNIRKFLSKLKSFAKNIYDLRTFWSLISLKFKVAIKEHSRNSDVIFSSALCPLNLFILNKHFESSQKLLKSSFVNERFKKYSMLPNELLTFETINFKNLKYYLKQYCVHLCCKLVLSIPIL